MRRLSYEQQVRQLAVMLTELFPHVARERIEWVASHSALDSMEALRTLQDDESRAGIAGAESVYGGTVRG